MTAAITLRLRATPPSSNKMYRRGPHNRMLLSSAATAYLNAARLEVMQQLDGQTGFNKDRPHALILCSGVPDLLTKGWPTKAANRFRRANDSSNLVKLLEDLVMDVFGIDDSSSLITMQRRFAGPRSTTVVLMELSDHVISGPQADTAWNQLVQSCETLCTDTTESGSPT